jgi:carboxyl-terminal processing protease
LNRPLKLSVILAPVAVMAWLSFVCGRVMRDTADAAPARRVRLSAMPETHLGALGTARTEPEQETDAAQSFLEVLRYVKTEFVDRIDDDRKLGFGAVRTMLVSLDDPKTRFFDPSQRKLLYQRLNGEYHGIGATLAVVKQSRNGIDQRRVAVVAPVPGGPADRAGIRPGDVITELDGRWIIAYDTRQDLDHLRTGVTDEKELKRALENATARMLSGLALPKALEGLTTGEGRKIALTVERSGHPAQLKVEMTTAETRLEPVEYRSLSPKVGYLRVTQFNDRAAQKIDEFLPRAKGRSLIVDLRDNPGGPVSTSDGGTLGGAMAVLERLVSTGAVASVQRPGGKSERLQVTSKDNAPPRIVAIVNSGTCNLAELTAAALRDRAGAKLVGEQTFGDATWQKVFDLRDGAAMTVTAGKILTSKGADFSGKGLQPDEHVSAAGPKPDDAAARKALELLERAS